MKIYYAKTTKLKGTSYREVLNRAFKYYDEIKKLTKRKPYVRSAYFSKNKIFLELFWLHLFEKKNRADRVRRLRLLPCAIELIKKSRIPPTSKENPNRLGEILHRFSGFSFEKELFFVQIKENRKSTKKWLISCFPDDK